MSTKSRERIYGAQIQASAERAKKARKDADQYACIVWNNRMLGYKGPAQPSPTIGDALNAGFGYLEVRCLGCAPDRRAQHRPPPQADAGPRAERYLRCKDCSQVRRYPYKRRHLVALRQTKISASDPPSTWRRGSDKTMTKTLAYIVAILWGAIPVAAAIFVFVEGDQDTQLVGQPMAIVFLSLHGSCMCW